MLAQPVTLRTEPQASRAYLQMTTNFTVSSSPLLSALSDTSRGYSASKCRLMTSWLTTLLASSERFIPPIQNCRNIVDGVRRSSHFAEPITSTFSISLGTRWFLSHIGSWQRRHNHVPARSNKQNCIAFAQIEGLTVFWILVCYKIRVTFENHPTSHTAFISHQNKNVIISSNVH